VNPVVLAGDWQLQRGPHIAGLFMVVWGGMFGGIPFFISTRDGFSRADGSWVLLLSVLLGAAVFFAGLYRVLVRREVRLEETRTYVQEIRSFLWSSAVTPHPLRLFDRVNLSAYTSNKGVKSYQIVLRGAGEAVVVLGDFSARDEALTAGMRAARAAGLAFEERRDAGQVLRLAPQELAQVPAATPPSGLAWWQQPSAIALVAANLAPVAGVLFWGWHILPVMLLFWLENVIVGLFNIFKILLAQGEAGPAPSGRPLPFAWLGNIFLAAFFTVHYGMFCAGHGVFLVSMFGRDLAGAGRQVDIPDLPAVVADVVLRNGLIWAAIALVASHGVSFYVNFLKPRAYEGAKPDEMMFAPYKRVVILHVVIIFGGFFAVSQGGSVVPLLLLIGLKVVLDLGSHRREHAVPYEREMRDFMAEHGHKFVQDGESVRPPAVATVRDTNDRALSHYFGSWRADPQAAVPPGWIARAEFRDGASGVKVKLWSQGEGGLADEGEFDATLRGHAARIEFVEVRQHAHGRERIARFTGSDAGAGHVDLNEIQQPEGNPQAMQARSLTLERA
jgi:hypothetical protein